MWTILLPANIRLDVPWLEDKYLAWFGENKTSYTAKGKLLYTSRPQILYSPSDLGFVQGVTPAERGDTGPCDKKQLQKQQKGWGETLSGGMLGGGKK